MNKSLIRYDADAICLGLMATMGLKEKVSVLQEVMEGVCQQSSASTYGEQYQFNVGIQIHISCDPSEG